MLVRCLQKKIVVTWGKIFEGARRKVPPILGGIHDISHPRASQGRWPSVLRIAIRHILAL
jgi:hypothetical protein